jgi:hypothetical protein
MLSKCANPTCTASFLYFHQGKLFRMEMERSEEQSGAENLQLRMVRRTEFFWLCDECALAMTVDYDEKGSVLVRPADYHLREAS